MFFFFFFLISPTVPDLSHTLDLSFERREPDEMNEILSFEIRQIELELE